MQTAVGKVIIERLCISLSYVEEPLNSKVIKGFVPELRSRYVFFRVLGLLCSMYICYEHSMYVSHISGYLAMLHYYICFKTNNLEKSMNTLILPDMGLIVSLLFFNKNSFGMKQLMKVDMA